MSALVEGIPQSEALTFLVDGKELRLVVMGTHHLDHFLLSVSGWMTIASGRRTPMREIGVIFPMPVLGPENAVYHAPDSTPRRREVMRRLERLNKSSGCA